MIKPLLKVIPALTGNCKLACELNNYVKISDNEFDAVSRVGHIFPLSSNMHQKVFDVSFLNGAWEYDISKFYNSGYADTFFKDTFTFDNNNILTFSTNGSVVKDKNTDIEFGCKRVSYSKTGYQLNFFAPIYCDNVNDLPDYFEITIDLNNYGMYSATKKIKIDLTNKYSNNYLNIYLTKYFSKIDDNVIYMLPSTKQALYYGIDVWLGGFNKYKDNVISKIYTEETTINGYDACIVNGFKRNNLIIRQTMPLAFYFNVDDILDESEKKKFRNANLSIKGQYYKNGIPIDFYMFDDNYEYLSLPVLKENTNTGQLEYQYVSNNLLALKDNTALQTHDIYEYRFSNKLNKNYIRWKLKYSSDEHPYITNTNYNFSKNQGLYNLYYEYPQNYYWSSVFCNIKDNEINVLLPIGDNIIEYYSDTNYLVNKYSLPLNNYISNWFDMVDDISIQNIIETTDWADVHNTDNKVFYKGLLYNFSNIYSENVVNNKIDKFAILFYVDSSSFFTNNSISDYIYSDYVLNYNTSTNNIVTGLYSNKGNAEKIYLNSLYLIENTNKVPNNMTAETNQYFSYNTTGTGKYVELEDLGIDFYEHNHYVRLNEIRNLMTTENYNNIYSSIIEGYEILPISYLSNIISDNKILLDSHNSNYYFSYNNANIRNKLSELTSDLSNIGENRNSYTFFQKFDFISSYVAYNSIYKSIRGTSFGYTYMSYFNNATHYLFYPKELLDNNKTVFNVFRPIDYHNKFYGNLTYYSHIVNDANVLYLDPFNVKDKLENYYQLNGNIYIKDINDDFITLSDIKDTNEIYLYTGDTDRQTVLDLLDYKHTYCMTPEYEYNKFNVPKFITQINSICIKPISVGDIVVSYNYELTVNRNGEYITTSKTNITQINNTVNCYSYNLDYTDKIITNTINFTNNDYNHTSYISGYYYVSNIDLLTNNIHLVNYNKDNIYLQFTDNNTVKQYAYNANAMIRNNNIYIANQNCIGTYMYRPSYIFNNPQNLIEKISNISYISNEAFLTSQFEKHTYFITYYSSKDNTYNCTYSFTEYNLCYNTYHTTYLDDFCCYYYDTVYPKYSYYLSKYSYYFLPNPNGKGDNDILICFSNRYNTNIDKRTSSYYNNWTITNTLVNRIYTYWVLSSYYNFDICSYYTGTETNKEKRIMPDYSIYKMVIHNNSLPTTDVELSNIMFLYNENNFTEMYGRFMNNIHLVIFDKYINQFALNSKNEDISKAENKHINNFIYIKKTVLTNDEHGGVFFRDVFIPLYDLFGNTPVIHNLKCVSNYNFSLEGYDSAFELYFKKEFIKITKPIYDNIISLGTDKYKDMYIYRLQTDNDIQQTHKYINNVTNYIKNYIHNTDIIVNSKHYQLYPQSYTVTPFFDNVFYQPMESTVIYKSYLLNSLSEAKYIDELGNIKYSLYRYNSKDKLCLVDVSYISDFSYSNTYLFRPTANKPSFIYDKVITTLTPYSYVYTDNAGNLVTEYDPDMPPIISYSYVASKIPTYDKLTSISTEYINVTDNKEIAFNSYTVGNKTYKGYNLNTYTYNGITYGFYLNKITLKNVNNVFNLMFTDYNEAKYFTQINGISIINNHEYLTNNFKLLVPIIRYNLLNQLYDIPILHKQYKTVFKKRYINYKNNGVNHIIYDANRNDNITLYRYYDSIIPNIINTANIYTEYSLKTKQINTIDFDTNIYREDSNIYHYKGIRVYHDNDNYTIAKQPEYKYYNDSLFINLETAFDIFIGNDLSEIDVIKYQEKPNILKYFSTYINKHRSSKYNNDEILFLYNKYKVVLTSTSEKLDETHTNKIYSLTYKFSLK